MADVPGGDTGLLVRQYKRLAQGKDGETVEEYQADVGLLREARAHEEQAAREMGQWHVSQSGAAAAPKVAVVVMPSLPATISQAGRVVLGAGREAAPALPPPEEVQP